MAKVITCTPLVHAVGAGEILATRQTISFWGGVDTENGKIVDPRHELFDQSIKDKILVFPYGKGSAAAPLVLLELTKQQTGPAAIINVEVDPLLVAGPIIGKYFYDRPIPVVTISEKDFETLASGSSCKVDGEAGEIRIGP